MKTKRWNFVNADGQVLKSVVCDTIEAAYEKLKFNFPQTHMFIEINLVGEEEIIQPTKSCDNCSRKCVLKHVAWGKEDCLRWKKEESEGAK